MAVALIALFVALGGPAQAKKQLLDGGMLRKNSVTGRDIKNGSVAKADLTKGAVRSLMATPARSVRSAQIVDGQVLAPDLGAGSVGQAQLAAGARHGVEARPGLRGRKFGGERFAADGRHRVVHRQRQRRLRPVRFARTLPGCRGAAMPAGGQPNIADDVVAVSPPHGWSDFIVVTGKPAPDNAIRIVACWSGTAGDTPPDPPLDDLSLRDLRRALSIRRFLPAPYEAPRRI